MKTPPLLKNKSPFASTSEDKPVVLEGQVSLQLRQLGDSIIVLNNHINDLSSKLSDVVRPTIDYDEDVDPCPEDMLCPLAEKIRTFRERVQKTTEQVSRLSNLIGL